MADLEAAIQRLQEAFDKTPVDHSDRANRLSSLGIRYRNRYQRTGAIADLEAAIQRLQEAFDITPVDHPDRGKRFYGLGVGYRDRYQKTGAIADLEAAIQRFQEALNITSADHPDRANRLYGLGVGYRDRYRKTRVIADLEAAIQRFQEALDITPADHPDRANQLHGLGVGYHDRYQRTGAIADLEVAIQRFQEALNITSADHLDRANRLHGLGTGYHDRYGRTGAIADLEAAIQQLQEALDTTPAYHPDRANRLYSLGVGYRDRYRRIGVIADLEVAIQQLQEALDMTPADHPDRANRLYGLGTGYSDRYRRTGAIVDLEVAIQQYQKAVDITSANYLDRADGLYGLGTGYRDRYRRTGAMADLEVAIQQLQEAFDITPADHPDRADRLYSLGTGYRDRYRRTGVIADLEAAIQQLQEALDMTPADHPDRADRIYGLGTGYRDRYQRTEVIADLEAAIQQLQEAFDITPVDHSDRANRLYSLGVGYCDRYGRRRVIADLEAAIQRYQEALDITPADHPDRANRLYGLGTGYRDRYRRTGAMADLEAAIQRCQEALDHSSAPITDRLKAGRILLTLHADAQKWPQAHEAASKTVSLVPLLTPRSLETSDKQHLLIDIVDLASSASAIALNAAKTPFNAVQALELGRGVITGSLNEIRADVFDLQQKHPQIAEEYIALRDQLDAPTISTQTQTDQRYNASQKLEGKIQQIQRLPDFNRFLLAPSEDELKTAAEYGPIVIINVSDYRCDALIIEKTQIRALQLPHLHISDIRDRVTETMAELEVLEWLWEIIAQPVLKMLGFTQTPSSGCWPHVWWIPTGLLAKFPIHAAGRHSQSSSDTVLDRVISSYSSAVKTIIHSRRRRSRPITAVESEKVVLLAMQKTPKQGELQFATQEIHELERLCSSMKLQVVKPLPYKEQVLSALSGCKIFHFAGHGFTSSSDPSKSHLLLNDWETEPLTVASLLEINLWKQAPFLAYLSACGTGQIKQGKFIDESLHLISACQLAGFRHVVGTLWKVNDEVCVDMARIMYERMKDGGITDESVSSGLHQATRELRRRWLSAPAKSRCGHRLVRETIGSWAGNETGTMVPRDSDEKYGQLLRDADLDEETGPANWVPYFHFGV